MWPISTVHSRHVEGTDVIQWNLDLTNAYGTGKVCSL